jgi:small subunit ribosomal protein S4
MARYIGPKTKKSRAFGESIFGDDKSFERRKTTPPGQHGGARKRKQRSDYAVQLMEKQKAKYTYGLLERQFWNVFDKASRAKGITGENLLQLLETRLDNVVYRLGLANTRAGARQLVSHKHITLNGVLCNIPSAHVKVGELVGVRVRSKNMEPILESVSKNSKHLPWVSFDKFKMEGKIINMPLRADIPENIKEQLIVELYSK